MQKLVKLMNKKNRGFTLIELIVVIGILAILAALAIPAVAGYLNNSKARTNVSNAKIIYNAANAYLAANPADSSVPSMSVLINSASGTGYLAKEPKTAGDNSYSIGGTVSAVTITWSTDTSLPAELSGTYPQ